jgi:hypothetical protein
MSGNIFGQSTKESYRTDIEDSLKQKTIYKNYEYFDDYSYGSSDKIGFWLCKQDNKKFLFLFQSDGPKTIDILKKLLEWRRSGLSNEVGHKGGGNKRNIYGFKSNKTSIFSKLDDTNVLFCETTPNKLYELSLSDMDEQNFRNVSDSSTYIKSPEKIEVQELPAWYSDTYNKIYIESNIAPNYMIRMELTDIPEEYYMKEYWIEYINQVRAKQYEIPIYFKNDFLEIENYETYENIDFVGFHDKNKISDKMVPIYIHKTEYSFFVKDDSSNFINVKNNKEIKTCPDDFFKWGTVQMFIVSNTYFKKELEKYNENLNTSQTLKYENIYGVYLKINNKLTNYLPIDGKLLGESKNNGIHIESGQKNNSRFRMIFIPNNEECLKDSLYFDSLIQTETIKALSGFLHKSPYKNIIKNALDIYKGKDIFVLEPKVKPNPKPKIKNSNKKKIGAVYIIYLGYDLFKFGYVSDFDRLNKRINEHKRDSIKQVKSFLNKSMTYPHILEIYSKKTIEPKGFEEKICNILQEDQYYLEIELFENRHSKNDIREFFTCNIDFLIQNIIPRLEEDIEI